VSSSTKSLAAASQRIRAAYSPDLLKDAGHRLVELLAAHLAAVEASDRKVLNWEEPPRNVEAARSFLKDEQPNTDSQTQLNRFGELVQAALDRGLNLHDPRYVGHQVPASVPVAGLFDAVGSVTNQVMAIYEMGPWASSIEEALVDELGQLIGWETSTFAGFVTHGGSLANLTALLTARNVTLEGVWEQGVPRAGPHPVLVAHPDTHYSIDRAAGVLGFGTRQVIRAEVDERRRIDPEQLDSTLRGIRADGHPIVAVVACACATPIGAFDPLENIADVCAKHGVWMHVDAAHGAAVCFSDQHRHLVAGLDRADSLVWDAHKMLFVPALCAFVFYRDKKHRFEAFRQEAPYLFDPSAPGLADYDSGLKTVECTKRAATLGLWGTWSFFGKQLFADLVNVTFDLGRQFHDMLAAADDFVPLHVPECNIVAFRHVPKELRGASSDRLGQFQWDVRREVIRSGEFYLVPTSYEGVGALRVTIINPLTTSNELEQLLNVLRAHGKALLAE
jgi:L-2,4-diaminobutyrate decarboxylase